MSWLEVKLGDVAKWSSGGTPSRVNKGFYSGNIPWIKSGELKSKFLRNTEERISESAVKNSSAKLFPKGAVAIAMYGATIGDTSILDIDATTNQAIAVAIPDPEKLDAEFLYYYLLRHRETFVSLGKGGAQPNISQTILKDFPIRIPSIELQKEIVKRIESFFSEVESGIQELEVAKKNLELYRQSILNAAIRGKIVPQDSKDEPASVLLAKIQKEKEKLVAAKKIKKEKPLPPISQDDISIELPRGWAFAKLKNVIKLYSGQHIEASDYNTDGHGTPYLTGPSDFGDVNPTITKWTTKPKVIAPPRSILVTVKGSGVGKANFLLDEGVCISRQLMAVEPIFVNSRYIEIFLHKSFEQLAKNAQGLIPGLSREDIEDLICPIPPLAEQTRIVQKVTEILNKANECSIVIEENLRKSQQLKQSILKKAFEGGLKLDEKIIANSKSQKESSYPESLIHVEKAKKKLNSNEIIKKTYPSVSDFLNSLDEQEVSAQEVASSVTRDYDDVKEELFRLISSPDTKFEQFFSNSEKMIKFRRKK